MYIAAKKGHLDICKLFIDKGIDVNEVYNDETALYVAAFNGHTALCKYFIS